MKLVLLRILVVLEEDLNLVVHLLADILAQRSSCSYVSNQHG